MLDYEPEYTEQKFETPSSFRNLVSEQKVFLYFPDTNSVEVVYFIRYNDKGIPIVQRRKDYWTKLIALTNLNNDTDRSYWSEEKYRDHEEYKVVDILVSTDIYYLINIARKKALESNNE